MNLIFRELAKYKFSLTEFETYLNEEHSTLYNT